MRDLYENIRSLDKKLNDNKKMDYKDEVCVILINLGEDPFEIKPGDRIAQGILAKVEKAEFTLVPEVSKENDRGGGFGHTGIS